MRTSRRRALKRRLEARLPLGGQCRAQLAGCGQPTANRLLDGQLDLLRPLAGSKQIGNRALDAGDWHSGDALTFGTAGRSHRVVRSHVGRNRKSALVPRQREVDLIGDHVTDVGQLSSSHDTRSPSSPAQARKAARPRAAQRKPSE
jgi:hypothetical protein